MYKDTCNKTMHVIDNINDLTQELLNEQTGQLKRAHEDEEDR